MIDDYGVYADGTRSAGTTRVAMRTGEGTGTAGLNWLLPDHPSLRSGRVLGSTAITADDGGNKVAELRYKGWCDGLFF